mgnify:CR=1 FL=1|jgi:hypothetical protein
MSAYPLGKMVGVVGGGQLGRMMADPVHRLGFKIAVLDPGGPECAAAVMSDRVVHGGLKVRAGSLSLSVSPPLCLPPPTPSRPSLPFPSLALPFPSCLSLLARLMAILCSGR